MSPARNGAGSHFASSAESGRSSRGEGAIGFETSPVDPVFVDLDSTYPGMFSSPNGYQASVDPSMPVPGSRRATERDRRLYGRGGAIGAA